MQETFGPVTPIIRAPNDVAATTELSNSTGFGLSAGLCTNDWTRMRRYIYGLSAGTANLWEAPGCRTEMSPSGGIKDSGPGCKEGVFEAMKSCTSVKTYSLPWG